MEVWVSNGSPRPAALWNPQPGGSWQGEVVSSPTPRASLEVAGHAETGQVSGKHVLGPAWRGLGRHCRGAQSAAPGRSPMGPLLQVPSSCAHRTFGGWSSSWWKSFSRGSMPRRTLLLTACGLPSP